MAAGDERDSDSAVAEYFSHDPRLDASRQNKCGIRAWQIAKTDPGQPWQVGQITEVPCQGVGTGRTFSPEGTGRASQRPSQADTYYGLFRLTAYVRRTSVSTAR